jgi:ParB/RepB/Spo0J family partition protein
MAKPAVAIATAPALETDPGSFQILPIAKLVESPSNHRRKSWGNLDELAESIKAKGVLVPICVRPAPAGLVEGAFEIVYGHRRFRAATKAGLPAMPAIVRELTDVEVIEAQVIENLQRTDVHPLEEAEGYEQLLASKDRPYTVDDIAAKVGKSKAYVYARMKLLDLTKESREAFYEGKLTPSTALYLARIPAELQAKALKALTPEWREEDEGPMSAREASEILQNDFMCRLRDAPFKLADADLLPSAGPCTTCPRRSGAQPDLFDASEGIGADVCTDPKCFAVKKAAAWTKRSTEAEAAGRKVLSPKETKGIFDQWGMRYGADYVEVSTRCGEDPKARTYKALLGKRAADAIVLAKDPKGAVHELLPKAEIPKLLKDAGHDFKVDPPVTAETTKAERERQKAEAQLHHAFETRRREVVLAALAKREPDDELWRLVARANEDAAHERLDDYGHTAKTVDVPKHVETLKGKDLRAFALTLALDGLLERYPWGDKEKAQKQLFAWAKVDEKAIRAEAKEAFKAAEKAAAAPAKGKAGELKWVSADDEHTAEPVDGLVYHVAPTPGGKTWVAKVSTTHGDSWKTLGTFTTLLSDAKKLCQADLLERAADGILKNAGAGELTKKDTKGAAVKRKGARR